MVKVRQVRPINPLNATIDLSGTMEQVDDYWRWF
jgi:hypothetical protein